MDRTAELEAENQQLKAHVAKLEHVISGLKKDLSHLTIGSTPQNKQVLVADDAKIYATKSSIRLVEKKRKIKKKGFGWSGCAASALPGWFWVVSDNESKCIFKTNFETGEVIKLNLATDMGDLEGITSVPSDLIPVPHASKRGPYEGFIICCSSSINKRGGSPSALRDKVAFLRVPIENEKIPAKLVEGKHQYTLEDFRGKIVKAFAKNKNVELDTTIAAKHGGLDIEGICFTSAKDLDEKHHTLWLGLRGPQTKATEAILVPVRIPKDTLNSPADWKPDSDFKFIQVSDGLAIRDIRYEKGKDFLILGGPVGQDKAKHTLTHYPLVRWNLESGKALVVGKVPRLPNGQIDHSGIVPPALKGSIIEKLQGKEKGDSFASPEGIALYNDQLLVTWDHNDAGIYAVLPYPK
eukprot:TRINITY_DN8349_c0_g1_i1.p1 TRINITY_DN8349_c0_g1~~TRINITY_DN8349_c0_g1_i1.p1  ORF type:complete len:409 (-),score=95.41 TRINITY_DN8349_c0_g1_i1:99-1325(-)